ncbi:50S ribosomal protein L20 [candidate division WOR-3 bacterium]|nr:50S ribosomal protein L20 [candidate division WOR-3 bacterium]
MPRAKGGPKTRHRRKKWLKLAKGYWGKRGTAYKSARLQVMKSLFYAYQDRRRKKRRQRQIAICQINAGCRKDGIPYSKFINALKELNIMINRKELALLAQKNPDAFSDLTRKAKDMFQEFNKNS